MKDRTRISNLKQTIKTLALQGREIHKQIVDLRSQPETGSARSQLWAQKRDIGTKARRALLAYAYLRGVPYRIVEPVSVQGNVPYPTSIAEYVVCTKLTPDAWSQLREEIKDWLAGKAKVEQAQAEPCAAA